MLYFNLFRKKGSSIHLTNILTFYNFSNKDVMFLKLNSYFVGGKNLIFSKLQ